MKDDDDKGKSSTIRKSLLTHALLKGADIDDASDGDDTEREKTTKVDDAHNEDQTGYSMKEIETVLDEAAEDIEESGIFDGLAENIEEIVRVGSLSGSVKDGGSMDERREASTPKTTRGGKRRCCTTTRKRFRCSLIATVCHRVCFAGIMLLVTARAQSRNVL